MAKTITLLEQLERSGVNVDVDSYHLSWIKAVPFTPHDVTSNQIVIHQQITLPENKDLIESTIKEMKDAEWLDIHTVLTARFAKRIVPLISGRVLAQVSPRFGYDQKAIEAHCRAYQKAFNAEGVSDDRYMIKIPTTSAGVNAAKNVIKDGIRSLGTALFSLPQAIAASQAGMLAISPYFNETRAHVDADLWPDVEDPATQHPMSNRMIHIRQTYNRLAKETGKTQPHIKAASTITARETLAMKELGVDHVTILAGPLEDMLNANQLPPPTKGSQWQKRLSELGKPNLTWADWDAPEPSVSAGRMGELAKCDPLDKTMSKDWKMASTDVNYLQGKTLDEYIEKDEVSRIRLKDALDVFTKAEEESKVEIERLRKELA